MTAFVPPQQGSASQRVVLLRDERWPQVPGVCCWRSGVHAAFGELGATVTEVTWPALRRSARTSSRAQPAGRLAWLPPAIRTPLARMYRVRGTLLRAVRSGRWPAAQTTPGLPVELTDATLVIAESLGGALAAVAEGVPQRRVWALVLPADRLHSGGRDRFTIKVAQAAGSLGGLLTDSEAARDSLERAAASSRPRVEVFPPLAADRACPTHSDAPARDAPSRLPASAAQLALWRRIIDKSDGGTSQPGSFAAARLLGAVGRWAESHQPGWTAAPVSGGYLDDPELVDWSAGAQVRAARRIWHAVVPGTPYRPRPRRTALLAGFDLKFAHELAERLTNRTDLELLVDEWRGLSRRTPHTESWLARADAIFAEWARTSAIWYSQRKRPDQFLVVRLHRFELDAPYPRQIALENVDAVVYIAPLFGRRIRDELGWPVEKLVYIPNYLDLDGLDRPKLPEARFGIGFVGIEFRRKRFDLALDLLARVRREDHRFRLVVRSAQPWRNPYAWADPEEREYVGRCFERIERDPLLRHGVIFDDTGRDMARWFRRVGHVLSTSDEEGCHTAVGEGMASGAVPVVRPWPGAAEIYGREWVYGTVDAAAAAVLSSADADTWAERATRAKAEIRRTYDSAAVVDAWADLLHGEIARARSYFAGFSPLCSAEARAATE